MWSKSLRKSNKALDKQRKELAQVQTNISELEDMGMEAKYLTPTMLTQMRNMQDRVTDLLAKSQTNNEKTQKK